MRSFHQDDTRVSLESERKEESNHVLTQRGQSEITKSKV